MKCVLHVSLSIPSQQSMECPASAALPYVYLQIPVYQSPALVYELAYAAYAPVPADIAGCCDPSENDRAAGGRYALLRP